MTTTVRKRAPHRPTKLNLWRAHTILKKITNGLAYHSAALASGISHETALRWQTWGREGRPGFAALYRRAQIAERRFEEREVTVLANTTDERERARNAQFLLKSRFPEQYGDRREPSEVEEAAARVLGVLAQSLVPRAVGGTPAREALEDRAHEGGGVLEGVSRALDEVDGGDGAAGEVDDADGGAASEGGADASDGARVVDGDGGTGG